MCKSEDQQASVTRKHVNELEYKDEEGHDISYDPDGNNFIVESIEVPANQRNSKVQQFCVRVKDRLWRKVQRYFTWND